MRVSAVEVIAHGLMCDNAGCQRLVPVRNEISRPEGYYIDAERVTEAGVRRVNKEQLYFCSKECMLDALQWQFSHLVDTRVGPLPRSAPGPRREVIDRQVRVVEEGHAQ